MRSAALGDRAIPGGVSRCPPSARRKPRADRGEPARARLRAGAGRRRPAAPRRAAAEARPREGEGAAGRGRPARDRAAASARPRLAEALGTAFGEGEGVARRAARRRAAAVHGAPHLQRVRHAVACRSRPALFSFNNPRGACATCNGFGAVLEYDESLIVPDPVAGHRRRRDRPVDQAALRDAAAAAARHARTRARRRP